MGFESFQSTGQSPLKKLEEKKGNLPENFEEVLERMMEQKNSNRIMFAGTKNELRDMAEGRIGGGIDEIRTEYYPNWKNEDFKLLLEKLGIEHTDDGNKVNIISRLGL